MTAVVNLRDADFDNVVYNQSKLSFKVEIKRKVVHHLTKIP